MKNIVALSLFVAIFTPTVAVCSPASANESLTGTRLAADVPDEGKNPSAASAKPAAGKAATDTKGPADGGATDKPVGKKFSGNVSWYGQPFHGRKTASGQIFDMNKLTAAHKVLPFYTRVLVENPKTGKTVIVSVTDRGPFVRSRVMDLSREAARQLGTLLGGIAWVDCVVVGNGSPASGK